MRYLLDTNIVSDLIRNPPGRVAQHIREVGEARVIPGAGIPLDCYASRIIGNV